MTVPPRLLSPLPELIRRKAFTLRECFREAKDPWWRSVLLGNRSNPARCGHGVSVGSCATESLDAEGAIEAILRSGPSSETLQALKKVVANNPRLVRAFEGHRNSR